jgi:hypothetical protein
MKTKPSAKARLSLVIALALLIPAAAKAASTVTFENQSGKPALVKLVGPTASSVSVENSKKESAAVSPGHYFIKIRYGTPGAFSYSKDDEFDVTENASTASAITITLHKVVAGNYGSKSISEAEFGPDDHTAKQPSLPLGDSWRTNWQMFVEKFQSNVGDKSIIDREVEWQGEMAKGLADGVVWVKMHPPLNIDLNASGLSVATRSGTVSLSGKSCEPVNELCLKPPPQDRAAWKKVGVGEKVVFAAKIGMNPMGAGAVWIYEGLDDKFHALLTMEGGKLRGTERGK